MPEDSIIKKLKLLKVIKETENARTLLLEPMDGWKPVYEPGQFLTLVFYTKYGEKRRSFSLISELGDNNPLSITVKKIDNGEFSRPLVYDSKAGDIFNTSGIGGRFTLPENKNEKKFCFLAAGSGITPCFSLIKNLLLKSNAPVVLFYSNKSVEDTLFVEQLSALEKKYAGRFRMRLLYSNHSDVYHRRLSKWLLEQLLDVYVEATDKTLFYLCGPFEYMQMAEIVLLNRTPKENIIKESFSSLPRVVMPEPPDKRQHQVNILINGKTYQLNVQYPKSILRTAIENNIELPYSCQAGRCASCIATCTKGRIWMAYNEVLVDSEITNGRILTCQAFAVGGDAEITFDQLIH